MFMRVCRLRGCVVAALFASFGVFADGKTYYVDAALGSDANPGTAEAPFKTIQYAVNKSSNDTIRVAAGVYGPIATKGLPMTIIGAGIGRSIIDGGGTNRCAQLALTSSVDVVPRDETILQGFTLRNGRARTTMTNYISSYYGAGAYRGRLIACELTENDAAGGYGGGASHSILESCIIARNRGTTGSALYQCTAYNCSIVANRSTSLLSSYT